MSFASHQQLLRYLIITIGCFSLLMIVTTTSSVAQKYNFINYNVEDGLIQSQVTAFTQDRNNELWIGTFGGLSLFDGSNFLTYNKNRGLPQNHITSVTCDKNGIIWTGTANGISRFDGKQFSTYLLSKRDNENQIRDIKSDKANNIWVLANAHLYKLYKGRFEQEKELDTLTAITLDESGQLWTAQAFQGIFVRKNGKWRKEINHTNNAGLIVRLMLFGPYTGTLYCLTNHGLMVAEKGKLKTPEWMQTLPYKGFPIGVLEDSKGNIWLSMDDGGVWLYHQKNWTHYTYQNGLTDDNVISLFEDVEHNLWIGTNGSGIYRFSGSLFTYYDRSSGLSSPGIMSITQSKKGLLYFAGNKAGLYEVNKQGILRKIKLPEEAGKINSITFDSAGRLWIGISDRSGLWYYDDNHAASFPIPDHIRMNGIIQLYYHDHILWISSQTGLYRLQNNKLERENLPFTIVYASCSIGKDSLLISTLRGAYIYRTDQKHMITQPLLTDATVLSIANDDRYVYIGTDDRGVVIWEKETQTFSTLNQQMGLSCDYVYNLLKDREGNIWVGTGCGIDKISINIHGRHIRSFGKSDGLLGVENNANASFEDREGYLWFGTTRGVFRYNPYIQFISGSIPKVVLQSVQLFSKSISGNTFADSTLPFSELPYEPVFQPRQNHLTFTFKGVFLSNPEKVRYRYQLAGIDRNYTETDQTTVVYPNLPPGKYEFKIWASDADGNWYDNAVSYPFTINMPYYKTLYFRIGLGLLLTGLLLGTVYYRNRRKALRLSWEAELREEEQAKVRQKTAEDFHDEIGNKLTRINLLATIAEKKIQEQPIEVKGILQQIQKNVTSLYNGSKDIIWSLQPHSDYLDEIILKIRENIENMLQDTAIQFEFHQTPTLQTHIKLPIDYSRNLIMIFKEAVNNMIKHAHARTIVLHIKNKGQDHILFELKDDGKGFDINSINKGNGLGNMNNRANRINGLLSYTPCPDGQGTLLSLILKI